MRNLGLPGPSRALVLSSAGFPCRPVSGTGPTAEDDVPGESSTFLRVDRPLTASKLRARWRTRRAPTGRAMSRTRRRQVVPRSTGRASGPGVGSRSCTWLADTASLVGDAGRLGTSALPSRFRPSSLAGFPYRPADGTGPGE
ncbi:hypothetical protein PsYK624_159560 [Phanerochaete sordida]|uniref:Uncharacterized protein n=1 Tax=Phanerochaete sordida TaxID=48140 RepID=A0A9P3LLT0_9APHY|nr:hypothetical protein PsYK624_159560 [Phanerochaete sordida]